MRILLHCPDKSDGTSLVRGYGPYSKLKVDLVEAPEKKLINWTHLNNVDVVIFQRPASQLDVLQIETCKRFNKPVIIDYDDNSWEVDETNPAADFFKREAIYAAVRECVNLADIVTVSTHGLKEAVLEQCPNADVRVVPNAIDDGIFSFEPSFITRNKTILMRGAGSHKKDWEMYKEGVLKILENHPDYTLSVMGFHPEWLRQIPENQIRYYRFTDLPTYFHTLMDIRPEIMIVPLEHTKFNLSKSAIALFEGVLAGAAVLATNLPEFIDYRAIPFNSNESLVSLAGELLTDKELQEDTYLKQLSCIPKLSEVNELRLDILEEIVTQTEKYSPKPPVHKTATDYEFYQYTLAHGHTSEDPVYQKSHEELATYLINTIRPKVAVEYGCGAGGTILELLKKGVVAKGLELNPYAVNHFKEHYPMYENMIHQVDFTKEPIELSEVTDLGISIECFEHVSMPEDWWDTFIGDLATKYRYFYFTSTPYSDTESFESFWGHINVRRTTAWIDLFTRNGWEFKGNPRALVSWDCLFKSKLV